MYVIHYNYVISAWDITIMSPKKIIRLSYLLLILVHTQYKCDLSGLSVNVGESQITQSSKVRDLGVIFDQFLNFDDHITAICRSTHFHIINMG